MAKPEAPISILPESFGNVAGVARDPRALRRFGGARTQDAHGRGWDRGHFDDPNAPRDRRADLSEEAARLDIDEAVCVFDSGGLQGLERSYPSAIPQIVFDSASSDGNADLAE